jgi:hypothetical protein
MYLVSDTILFWMVNAHRNKFFWIYYTNEELIFVSLFWVCVSYGFCFSGISLLLIKTAIVVAMLCILIPLPVKPIPIPPYSRCLAKIKKKYTWPQGDSNSRSLKQIIAVATTTSNVCLCLHL